MINPLITVVSPVYKADRIVERLVSEITLNLKKITNNYEIVLVCDGSPDDSWSEICKQCALDKKVKGLNLSRNFGQQNAITAGLKYAKGDWIVVMDCDLQDKPEEIINLYNKAIEGWDIVQARRVNKKFGFWKKMSSTVFHRVFDWMSGMKTDSANCCFGIYSSKVIAEYNKMGEFSRSFDSMIAFLGYNVISVDVSHGERAEGESSYTFKKLFKLAMDTIISNSNKPLKMAVRFGIIMSFLSFVLALYNVVAKQIGIISVEGFTTTVFSIWFVGGLLLFMMGILGLYIGRIFDQVKGRPVFVVSNEINFD